MPTEQCVFLMLYIHGILYMYITKYSCVFLKLGESIYVAMDLIPILLGALPLAHNAQHSLVYRCALNRITSPSHFDFPTALSPRQMTLTDVRSFPSDS